MQRLSRIVVAIFIGLGGTSAFGQRDLSSVEIKTTHVAGNVHMLEGRGGNIGVSVGPDGMLMVDTQFAPLAGKIRAALGKLGEGELRFVLNTHWHADHTNGNPEFGPEVPIIAHTNVRKRLATEQELFGRKVGPLPKEGLPTLTFDESLSIHFNGEEIRVVHFPGAHTDGDAVVFFNGSNVVHLGDILFSGRFPFVDVGHGGDVEGLAKHIKTIMDQLPADVKIIPGHGPLSTLDDLRAYHRMLTETTEIVRKRMAAGKTLDQIKAEGLPEEWKRWSARFTNVDMWLEIVHRSLSKNSTGR